MKKSQVFGRVEAKIEAIIRSCTEEDLPALEWMGLYTPHRHIIREAFEAQERGDALLLLAVSAGFPIGQVWIDFARKRPRHVAVLWAVRTFYPLQGVGIGRQLLRKAESILRERGIRRAELEVERRNSKALRFYQRLGWRIAGRAASEPVDHATTEPDQWLLTKDLAPL